MSDMFDDDDCPGDSATNDPATEREMMSDSPNNGPAEDRLAKIAELASNVGHVLRWMQQVKPVLDAADKVAAMCDKYETNSLITAGHVIDAARVLRKALYKYKADES